MQCALNLRMRLEQIGFVLKRIAPQGEQGITPNKYIAFRCSHLTDVDGACFTKGTHVPFPPPTLPRLIN